MHGLEFADLLGESEALREQMDEGGVDIVDALTQIEELVERRLVGGSSGLSLRPMIRPYGLASGH